jgi:hypothetical protein
VLGLLSRLSRHSYISSDANPAINDLGQIVYTCDNPPYEHVYVDNFTGTGFAQITNDTMDSVGEFSINADGLIAYACAITDDEICVINYDGTGFAQITNNSTSDQFPDIR